MTLKLLYSKTSLNHPQVRYAIADYKLADLPEPAGEGYKRAVEVLLPYLLSHRSRLAAMLDQVQRIPHLFISSRKPVLPQLGKPLMSHVKVPSMTCMAKCTTLAWNTCLT